jgi:hypothetical protein
LAQLQACHRRNASCGPGLLRKALRLVVAYTGCYSKVLPF